MKISDINLKIILDSRDKDTLEAELFSGDFSVKSSVPAGKSTGAHEAFVLEPKKALEKIEIIKSQILSREFNNQEEFDNFLIGLDGTENKSNLGANLILALSLAFARLKAKEEGKEMFQYIRQLTTNDQQQATGLNESLVMSRKLFVSIWDNVKMVKEEYEKLAKKVFPDLRVEMLHGKMKAKEKNEIMKKFKDGETDILVSTSVVEVGVDVPNATIMMIESADKFGLAQLYQFRGRVGRGEYQSFCLLFTESASKSTYSRLRSLIEAKNGFELAEKDLAIRGPGEFLGEAQTGVPDLAMKAVKNPDLVKHSREAVEELLKDDPELKEYPLLKSRLELFQKEVHLE